MSAHIAITGPEHAGRPEVTMSVTGRGYPDMLTDLRNRAVASYQELFGALTHVEIIEDDDAVPEDAETSEEFETQAETP